MARLAGCGSSGGLSKAQALAIARRLANKEAAISQHSCHEPRPRIVRLTACVGGCVLTLALVSGACGRTGSDLASVGAFYSVPPKRFLAADYSGRLLVLDKHGRVVRRIPRSFGRRALIWSLELSPDRRDAYVSIGNQTGFPLYDVALSTGRKKLLAHGFGAALNPARTKLAYVAVHTPTPYRGFPYETALVIRDLRTHKTESIPLTTHPPPGVPPENVINWSPDGTHIAILGDGYVRLVDVATARTVESQPRVPGEAPVYLSDHVLVVLSNCCAGGQQHLTAINLQSYAQHNFATISSPDQNVWRIAPGTLLLEDALGELDIVSQHHVKVIATKIQAAAAA